MQNTSSVEELVSQLNSLSGEKGQTMNQQLVDVVTAVVQGVLASQGQVDLEKLVAPPKVKKAKAVTQGQKGEKKPKLVFVAEPFYMKNGGEQLGMLTQGAARNVPVELNVVKKVGNKAITIERYRARFPQYVCLRAIHTKGDKTFLGLRETENKQFESVEEAKKIIVDILKSLQSK